MTPPSRSPCVIWDITYACPLRCVHCYSESGRRASKQLKHEDMLRVIDVMIQSGAKCVQFSGGEPLLVDGVFELAGKLKRSGVSVSLYTNGWLLSESMLPSIWE